MEAFTTGAFIEPKKIKDKYYWIVSRFEDDTFINEIAVSNIQAVSDTQDGLTGFNNYRITPMNEGQPLNYSEHFRATKTEATAKAQKIANNLKKILASATITVELEEVDAETRELIQPTQNNE